MDMCFFTPRLALIILIQIQYHLRNCYENKKSLPSPFSSNVHHNLGGAILQTVVPTAIVLRRKDGCQCRSGFQFLKGLLTLQWTHFGYDPPTQRIDHSLLQQSLNPTPKSERLCTEGRSRLSQVCLLTSLNHW